MQRRLSAILAADVVGYSGLMAEDEVGTLAALKRHREDVFDPETARHGGRIVKLMGDGALVEFPSVVDAVECALAVQTELASGAARLRLRIGINLGDVMIEGDDIYGDGVNVAARLEPLAPEGGIAISATVHDQVRRKVDAGFRRLGSRQLKNIAEPVEVWQWTPDAPTKGIDALPYPALPDKPSIAVLPFTNMSGDPEQEYFADGITEDIITGLSRFRWLFVIARNSTFSYKGKAPDIRAVGRELGVRYVLEGSVRKAANRVRITAQLIEAETGNHLWAERYDRLLEDIFDLQDEITSTLIGAIEPELGAAERTRSRAKPTENLDAWDCYLRARPQGSGYTREDFLKQVSLCEQAIALSPDMAVAYSELAFAHSTSVLFGYAEDRERALDVALSAARRAVQLDPRDATAQTILGRVYDLRGRFDDALQHHQIALDLNPNSMQAHLYSASTYNHAGKPELALPAAEQAIRLSPRDPSRWFMQLNRDCALSMLGRHDEAIAGARLSCHIKPDLFWPHIVLAVVLAHAGQLSEAREALAGAANCAGGISRLRQLEEAFTTTSDTFREFLVSGARKAGMPQ